MMPQRPQSKNSVWEVSEHGLSVWGVPTMALFHKSLIWEIFLLGSLVIFFKYPDVFVKCPGFSFTISCLTAKPAWNIPFPVPVFTAPAIMFVQFLRGCATNQSTEIVPLKNSTPRKKVKPEALVTTPSLTLHQIFEKYRSKLEEAGCSSQDWSFCVNHLSSLAENR